MRRRKLRIVLICSAAALLLAAGWLATLWHAYRSAPGGAYASAGPNAAWASHGWVGERKPADDYALLAADLARHRITDVFFHVGPLDGDGTLPPARYPHAADLLAALKGHDPRPRLQAWLGQVEKRGGGPLDLSLPETRANIVRAAATLLDLGFDGIHYNFEPTASGSPHLLALLEDTRALTEARGKVLSMATDELEVVPGLAWLVGLFAPRGGYWSGRYYDEVARRVDQVAVMTYDTLLPFDWLYGNLVAWETANLLRLLGGRVTLFMGVPTYEDRRLSFRPEAENMRSAMRGLTMAAARLGLAPRDDFGVAIYALWTTSADEWSVYRGRWLGEAEPGGPGGARAATDWPAAAD